jgi:hypothetical protein
MERQNESPVDAPAQPPLAKQSSGPRRLFGLEAGDLVPFCILMGFSAWLWSRASESLGSGAALIGAAIGLAVAYLVRTFC